MTTSQVRVFLYLATALVSSVGAVTADPILLSHVDVSAGPTVWTYTVYNDQTPGDSIYISSFALPVAAPILDITSPDGWVASSDYASYVEWFNTDPALPYPNDISPGGFLSGFSVSSTATSSELLNFGVSGWDHVLDQPGPSTAGTVLAPSTTATTVPEPSSLWLLALGCCLVVVWRASICTSPS